MTLLESLAAGLMGAAGASCIRKCRFPSRERAAGYGRGRDGYKVTPYFCPACKGWHLTKHAARSYSFWRIFR